MLTVVNDDASTREGSLIDDIVREGAPRMLAAALEAEVDAYIAELAAVVSQVPRRSPMCCLRSTCMALWVPITHLFSSADMRMDAATTQSPEESNAFN